MAVAKRMGATMSETDEEDHPLATTMWLRGTYPPQIGA